MIILVKAVCVLLAFYGVFGIFFGSIYSIQGKLVERSEQPIYFWLTCLSNIVVGVVCFLVLSS